ncbi:DUF2974 domain-containing protein [Babesia caballi]|uniref:DUF2974 domain-containing protein n=1 Tax=Babesia caballi TaxID=5871 RepID=A0AAV4M163_BABCB|nr:DUF2974 domain-containing protein [Babesia caballi]
MFSVEKGAELAAFRPALPPFPEATRPLASRNFTMADTVRSSCTAHPALQVRVWRSRGDGRVHRRALQQVYLQELHRLEGCLDALPHRSIAGDFAHAGGSLAVELIEEKDVELSRDLPKDAQAWH